MNIFAQARQGLNLTPGQRATLKLIEGFAVAGIVAALPIVADALSHGNVNWSDAGRAALAAASTAAILAALKYAKAHGDAPLATAIGAVDTTIGAQLHLSGLSGNIAAPVAPDANAPILVQDEPAPAQ